MASRKKLLALEPYYGGSHKNWIDGWRERSRHDIHLLTLPARKWKWRMRGAAIAFAEQLAKQDGGPWDGLIATDMMNLAEFLSLTRPLFDGVPVLLYFHENQLSYPLQPGEQVDYHYGFTNLVSLMAATQVVFNSAYNLQDFFTQIRAVLNRMPDAKPSQDWIDRLESCSLVLEPAMDLTTLDIPRIRDGGPPVILWNHRWEHDKRPECLVEALLELDRHGWPFRVIICGERFRDTPACFETARAHLGDRILHMGYAPTRHAYCDLLARSEIVVSTAVQEFFGISVVEAMYAGAFPILPACLNYPALLPEQYHKQCLYSEGELGRLLEFAVRTAGVEELPNLRSTVARYDWSWMLPQYDALFDD